MPLRLASGKSPSNLHSDVAPHADPLEGNLLDQANLDRPVGEKSKSEGERFEE